MINRIYNKKSKWLFVPIEVKAREYISKLLFSCIAAENKFNIVFGGMGEIKSKMDIFPKGIYVGKDIFHKRKEKFVKYKNLGNKIIAWDEEGLVFLNRNLYMRQRISKDTLDKVDLFFTWGKEQLDTIVSKYPEMKEKFVSLGNPRIDLLRPEIKGIFKDSVECLRGKYGKYILINGNFLCNHIAGLEFILDTLREHTKEFGVEDREFYKGYFDYSKKMLNYFTDIIPLISNTFKDFNIILRPHPSENHEYWRGRFSSLRNVKVINNDNIIPWIIAADVVIHNSCTTGIEAFILKTPVISYRPVTSEVFDQYLPNVLSLQVFNDNDLIDELKKILQNKNNSFDNYDKKMSIAKKYIENIDGELSSTKIIREIKKISIQNSSFSKYYWLMSNIKNINLIFKKFENIVNFIKKDRNISKYDKQKFPGIKLDEIQFDINKLKKATGRFTNINIKKIGRRIFLIENSKEI